MMNPIDESVRMETRRQLLRRGAQGIGAAALASLLQGAESGGAGLPHFAPKAKRVIWLHMVGAPPQLDLLDLDDSLLAAGLMGLLFLFVLKLAVIANLTNRGLRVRRNLHEVQTLIPGHPESFRSGYDPELVALIVDQTHLRHTNALVNAMLVF